MSQACRFLVWKDNRVIVSINLNNQYKMLRIVLKYNNCSISVSTIISVNFWLSWQNSYTPNIAYSLVLLLYLQLLCNRLKNTRNLLALLIYKFRGRVGAFGLVRAFFLFLCRFLSFACLCAASFFRLASIRAARRPPATAWTVCFLVHTHWERKYYFPWPSKGGIILIQSPLKQSLWSPGVVGWMMTPKR